jgi:pimeloyl-ACP methyl ester carboxylesterase
LENPNKSKALVIALVVALCLILGGDMLASFTQTDWGNVKVSDVRFEGTNKFIMSGLLYVPKSASASTPAPGIVVMHGYTSSREYVSSPAIEMARRGFVVLACDQTGHGNSDPPAYANGYGGIDALKYLSTLDIVDKNNIGLEGYSMGGWAVGEAASALKNGYKAMVMGGSATGYPLPNGTPTWPRNYCLIEAQSDEFSQSMYGAAVARDIVKSDKLKALFGTKDDVVVGKLYGSVADGTARKLYMPPGTHGGYTSSAEAIADGIEWFQTTLQGGNGIPVSDQIWRWKDLGSLLALLGMVLLLFPVGGFLLRLNFFNGLVQAPAEPRPAKGVWWWLGAAIFVVLPVATYYAFKDLPTMWRWTATALIPQYIATALMVWGVLTGAILLALVLIWHYAWNKKAGAASASYGLGWDKRLDWKKIGKAFLLAVTVGLISYLTVAFSAWMFTVDFRAWGISFKLMSPLRFQMFLGYLIPFVFFFIMLNTVLLGVLRRLKKDGGELSIGWEMLISVALMAIGWVGLLIAMYTPLVTGGTLLIPAEALFSIMAFQFLPIMVLAALVFTYFYRKTGHVYAGAFLTAILVVWIIVASQAINFAPSEKPAATAAPSTSTTTTPVPSTTTPAPGTPASPGAVKAHSWGESDTYTNDQYGVSLQYPKNWITVDPLADAIFVLVATRDAGADNANISVVADTADVAKAIKLSYDTNPVLVAYNMKMDIVSSKAVTLSDGKTPATEVLLHTSVSGIDLYSYTLAISKGGKLIFSCGNTLGGSSQQALVREIAQTLAVK